MSFFIDTTEVTSRLLLGTALYPSLEVMQQSILSAKVQVITVALRRQLSGQQTSHRFWDSIKNLNCRLLPNTAGCFNAKEAIYTANAARELFETNWIKLEVIGDANTLQPHPFELLKACEQLLNQGFFVLPYCTEDLILCQELIALGCEVLMPWGSPIGTGKGLLNCYGLKLLRQRIPHKTLIIDAGMGCPSHAAQAMELGFDAVLLNSAVALAMDPSRMAQAFALAIAAGREAYEAGMMPQRENSLASTPLLGKPFTLR